MLFLITLYCNSVHFPCDYPRGKASFFCILMCLYGNHLSAFCSFFNGLQAVKGVVHRQRGSHLAKNATSFTFTDFVFCCWRLLLTLTWNLQIVSIYTADTQMRNEQVQDGIHLVLSHHIKKTKWAGFTIFL